jgi:hypothetical protein
MTMRKAWYVACSTCGWVAQVSTESTEGARGIAWSEGFIYRGGRDLCPGCQGDTLACTACSGTLSKVGFSNNEWEYRHTESDVSCSNVVFVGE